MTVGVLGAGQLGRMLALAGHPLGIRTVLYDEAADAPAGQVAELTVGAFDDWERLREFVRGVDVVTYEFENVPGETARFLADLVPVFPPPEALRVAQDRLLEKQLFQRLGVPTPAFAPIASEADLHAAMERIGVPAVLKTRRFGYDGKGQALLRTHADASAAWRSLGGSPGGLILEAFVPFEREVSVLAVRGRTGEQAFYPLVENVHREGILRVSRAPASAADGPIQEQAERHASAVVETLGYVGVLAIEFFQVPSPDGPVLLANEMAPRVHNSGHWTIEGAETSQFENHMRAVCEWPLGSTAPVGCSVMLNLIGSVPEPAAVLGVPGAHLHDYGKSPRAGRKVGHITVRGGSEREVEEQAREVCARTGVPCPGVIPTG